MNELPGERKTAAKAAWVSEIPPLGLECRGCGCRHFHVIYTRPAADGKVFRRRECRNCGRRISTVEREK